MDYIVKTLSETLMKEYIIDILEINNSDINEYWNEDNFLLPLPLKFEISCGLFLKDKIIGYIIASQKDKLCYIHKMFIHKNYRACGYGKILLEHFIFNVCTYYNFNNVLLSAYEDNNKVVKFYNNSLFKLVDKRLDNVNNKKLVILCREI